MGKTTRIFKNLLIAGMVLYCCHSLAQPVFVPNQGQWGGDFLFKTDLTAGAIFFEKTGYSVLLTDPKELHNHHHGESENHFDHHEGEIKSIAYKMKWVGASLSSDKAVSGFSKHTFYHNYFLGNNPSKWKSEVPAYRGIKYQELYPGIGVNYYQDGDDLKYDIHLEPNANPEKIRMQFEGINEIEISESRLVLHTPIGTVSEYIPEAYQIVNGEKIPVTCEYVLKGKTVAFELGNYNVTLPLVIDPVLDFSTFSGATSDNWGFTATYDDQGNYYGGGIVEGAGYPVTTGSFQTAFGGSKFDVAISKFSPDGKNLLFATFIGGTSIDMPHSMIVDGNDNLIILGSTGSTDFPMVNNSYQGNFSQGMSVDWTPWQTQYHNGVNAFVVKLNTTGSSMLSGTFLGSTNGPVGTNTQTTKNYCDQTRGEVIVLNNGNVAITTSTEADDLPFLKPGAGPGANSQNAIVAVFNPTLTQLVWGSYYGGTSDEAGYSIKTDGTDVFICGGTKSSDLPMHSTAFESVRPGDIDGYIAKFNGGTGQFLGATYVGTPQYDQAFFIDIDKFGSIFVFGQSQGSMPVTSGHYANANSQQFLQKYSNNLSTRLWATVIGSSSAQAKIDLVPTAFMVDQCLNIYISGWGGEVNINTSQGFVGGSTTGLPVTNDALKSTTDGSDFYFMVLDRDATGLLFGSFYGGNGVAHEHVDGGTSRFSPDGVIYQAVCAACGNGSFPTTPGVYSPTAQAVNCNLGALKISLEQTVKAVAQIDFKSIDTLCDRFTVTFKNQSQNAHSYHWDFGNGQTSGGFEPTTVFKGLGKYHITLVAEDTICDIADTSTVEIDFNGVSRPQASMISEYYGCDTAYQVDFSNTSNEVNEFLWDFGDGQTSTDENPTHFYADSGVYQVILIAYDTACFLSDTVYATIIFSDTTTAPKAAVSYKDCSNGELTVAHVEYRERYVYDWTYSGKKASGAHPDIHFDKPGFYRLYLNIEDPLCKLLYAQQFQVEIEALQQETYIPNAFSPNDDGINEEFILSGNACNQLTHFRIYNRWGQIVFETDSPFTEFWDGSYKGRPAKEDVYTYVLRDGDKVTRHYITLFR